MAEQEKVSKFAAFSHRVTRWGREMRSELKKVVWPTPKQVLNNSIIVCAMVAVVAVVVAVFDWGITQAVSALLQAV